MEFILIFIAFIIIVGAFAYQLLYFVSLQFEIFSFTFNYFRAILLGQRPPKYNKIGWFVALVTRLKSREIDLLNKYCPYYTSLNNQLKRKFERRLIRFKYEKDFYYTKDSEKNRELMIMLLSAFAIQVSFGFRKFRFNHFRQIHIHKQSFGLQDYDWLQLSGFTSGSRGYIAFSETAFLKSIEYPNDGFNVAIHEFAHAIDLCGKVNERYLNNEIVVKWQKHACEEWEKMQNNIFNFLPDYAKKDVDEFYACAVERFFEQPEFMQERMPETFYLLMDLLQQNPLNKEEPISIETNFFI